MIESEKSTGERIVELDVEVEVGVRRFGGMLRLVRRQHGDPSLRDIAHSGGSNHRLYSHNTFARALSGKNFPRWPVVESLLRGCNAQPRVIEEVRAAWLAVAEVVSPIGDEMYPAELRTQHARPPRQPSVGHECGTCGAWVTDQEQHDRWHACYVSRRPAALRVVQSGGGTSPPGLNNP